jgi:hypothetical protein
MFLELRGEAEYLTECKALCNVCCDELLLFFLLCGVNSFGCFFPNSRVREEKLFSDSFETFERHFYFVEGIVLLWDCLN